MDKKLQALQIFTQILTEANVAVGVVFALGSALVSIFKGLTGNAPSLLDLANAIEAQLNANDAAGRAEIARLKVELGVV